MSASQRIRAAGAWGHLLLVVVLALGVFAMHTTGHPETGSGAAHAAVASGTAGPGTPASGTAAGTAPDTTAATAPGAHTEGGHAEGMAMDMSSLCVAVLTTWALFALLRAAFGRRAEWLVALRAAVVSAVRPNPPPPGPDLIQLSVLRI
ncbi:DUF6153 family protein [Streptomyces sp. CAU 1734]|uniref:DUF6153 family protein n=1 Tax=Streptomyces sp. CAU 1734 TaxID=3140360 RepID=UPI0032618389